MEWFDKRVKLPDGMTAYDAIVDVRGKVYVFVPFDIKVPPCGLWSSTYRSLRPIEEQIQYIRDNDIRKMHVTATNISFLADCPSIRSLDLVAVFENKKFDFVPLYSMPTLEYLRLEAHGVKRNQRIKDVDFSRIRSLRCLQISGDLYHHSLSEAYQVEGLSLRSGLPNKERPLSEILPNPKTLYIGFSNMKNLEGIEKAVQLENFELNYNLRLQDISALHHVAGTLKTLSINNCGKIQDFSVLNELRELEVLVLRGSNTLPDLSFIERMPKLRHLTLFMKVANGDLSPCMRLEDVWIVKHRINFSHRNEELPKSGKAYCTKPFEIACAGL